MASALEKTHQNSVDPSQATASLHVLGIEASCDDSAAALVNLRMKVPPNDPASAKIISSKIIAEAVKGQNTLHADYGGVVPEIAARAHAERLDGVVKELGISFDEIDLIAVTSGPGLIGGLHAASAFARALSASLKIPLIGVNHLAGHALSPMLCDEVAPPYLLLLISGGHCQFLVVEGLDAFRILGTTIDDSPGEAFDKLAKLLGLGFPGGPAIEQEAKSGNPARFSLPLPLLNMRSDGRNAGGERADDEAIKGGAEGEHHKHWLDFSFSGLKTATRRLVEEFAGEKGAIRRQDRADICASFEGAMGEIIAQKSLRAWEVFALEYEGAASFAVAGGVAANAHIRARLTSMFEPMGVRLVFPPPALCTDNAAMIAFAGGVKAAIGKKDPADLTPRARWPLDIDAAGKIGGGKKGARA